MNSLQPMGYGKVWQTLPIETYQTWFQSRVWLHQYFIDWLKGKDINTVLEIGCGSGSYPIDHPELFKGKDYTGIDISETAIGHCRSNSSAKFVCGDFFDFKWGEPFDLVFAHAVIDHIYQPELFIKRVIEATKKYAFIGVYHGLDPEQLSHNMIWDENGGCYNSTLSPRKIEKVLSSTLNSDEFSLYKLGAEGIIEIFKKGHKV